jgi:serine/threonine protein kinase
MWVFPEYFPPFSSSLEGSKTKKSVKVPTPWYIEVMLQFWGYVLGSERRSSGREASTNRKVAIKKIKVGQFKDGLDMSAIREVKYLRELKHQNVIEARQFDRRPQREFNSSLAAAGRVLLENEFKSRSRVPRLGLGDDNQRPRPRFPPGRHQELDGNDLPWA